eukprot:g147.t1
MKVLLRGARGVGKTTLFRKLQGQPFQATYQPTNEIEASQIKWKQPPLPEAAAGIGGRRDLDVARVEVWDVVDKAIDKSKEQQSMETEGGVHPAAAAAAASSPERRHNANLDDAPAGFHSGVRGRNSSASSSPAAPATPQQQQQQQQRDNWQETLQTPGSHSLGALDASTVDVYRGAHAVLLLYDITRRETFEHVVAALEGVPRHLTTVILGTCRDLVDDKKQKRRVDEDEARELARSTAAARQLPNESLDRGYGGGGDGGDGRDGDANEKLADDARGGEVFALEVSAKNNFGLATLHGLLNVPFLALKSELIQGQLAALWRHRAAENERMRRTIADLDYGAYLAWLTEQQQRAGGGSGGSGTKGKCTSHDKTEWDTTWTTCPITCLEMGGKLGSRSLAFDGSHFKKDSRPTAAEVLKLTPKCLVPGIYDPGPFLEQHYCHNLFGEEAMQDWLESGNMTVTFSTQERAGNNVKDAAAVRASNGSFGLTAAETASFTMTSTSTRCSGGYWIIKCNNRAGTKLTGKLAGESIAITCVNDANDHPLKILKDATAFPNQLYTGCDGYNRGTELRNKTHISALLDITCETVKCNFTAPENAFVRVVGSDGEPDIDIANYSSGYHLVDVFKLL